MAGSTLVVTVTGEPPQEYRVTPAIEVAVERAKHAPLTELKGAEGIYFIAYMAVKAVTSVPVFDDWLPTLEEVDWKAEIDLREACTEWVKEHYPAVHAALEAGTDPPLVPAP